jgi:hypothetical protein
MENKTGVVFIDLETTLVYFLYSIDRGTDGFDNEIKDTKVIFSGELVIK